MVTPRSRSADADEFFDQYGHRHVVRGASRKRVYETFGVHTLGSALSPADLRQVLEKTGIFELARSFK